VGGVGGGGGGWGCWGGGGGGWGVGVWGVVWGLVGWLCCRAKDVQDTISQYCRKFVRWSDRKEIKSKGLETLGLKNRKNRNKKIEKNELAKKATAKGVGRQRKTPHFSVVFVAFSRS